MSQHPKSDSKALIPLAAENLSVKFPEPPRILTPQDAARTRNAIMTHGVVTYDAKMAYERDGIATILATDKAGANKFVAERTDDDIIEDGGKLYIRQPAIKREIDRRIAEPRDAYQLDRLRDAEQCLDAVRDAPELENRRLKMEAFSRREMPKLKRKVLKSTNTCISGEPLQKDAEVHHVERIADNPDIALAPSNLAPANRSVHKQIHAAQAHTPQALNELAEQQGWSKSHQQDRE